MMFLDTPGKPRWVLSSSLWLLISAAVVPMSAVADFTNAGLRTGGGERSARSGRMPAGPGSGYTA